MTYTSYQEQLAYLDFVALQDYNAKPREIYIREMAAEVIKQPEAYAPAGWTVILRLGPRLHGFVSENDALPSPRSSFKQINVRLVPAAQGSPHVAQLLAEQQLRTEWP